MAFTQKNQTMSLIDKKGKNKRALTSYNIFMKDNFKKIYNENPNLKPTEIMKLVAIEWKIKKNNPLKISICLLNMLREDEVFELLKSDKKDEVEKLLYGIN